MALLACLAVLLLTAVPGAVGQKGFLSIDCGLDANSNGYNDTYGVFYVPDGSYVDGGENHMVAADREGRLERPYRTLRSFPTGDRNCYALPTVAGAKYLLRVTFFYRNYDGKDSSSTLQFDLYLGVDRWATVKAGGQNWYELLFVAWASWAPVCLLKTDPRNTPFVSSVELRTLASELYPELNANESMSLEAGHARGNMGSNISVIEYNDDPYDRYWWLPQSDPSWKNISTTSPIKLDPYYAVPLPVIQTAVEGVSNNTTLNIPWHDQDSNVYKVYMYFADFQNTQTRQLNVTINELEPFLFTPPYLAPYVVRSLHWYKSNTNSYTITVKATTASKLPPMINGFEVYARISHVNPKTLPKDFDTIMAIKYEYGIKKNWMGDPCFPATLVWDGVKCSNASGNIMTIISLDLSNSNLHGPISNNFTLFTALRSLNLSGNQLTRPIPEGLCNKQSFIFSLDSNGNPCVPPTPTQEKNRNRAVIIAISVVVPVVAIGALGLAYLIWRHKRKPNADLPRELEVNIALASTKDNGDPLTKVENRRFTYKELEKITNNFAQFIGQGGFGLVYYGRLEDGMEVAVKVRSESSSHGLDEFFAEVQSLTKVHHRNLVSLVGYCREKDHLALVYEYMARGSLYDHLRGNNGVRETLNWRTRLRVVIEAAQGLDYLHKGCNLPIIHRDVKTQNILLGQNLQAKIADFGLCKTYLSDTQTHISVNPAGSAGYMDPECYQTGRLTESSDVYSFGVVLLEIVTGESPILPGQGHIIQLVRKKISAGNISLVADARLGGAYDVSSMWKVVDIALSCTADIGAERPTMAAIVIQLKESLVLEEARLDSGFRGSISTVSDISVSTTTLSPLAR